MSALPDRNPLPAAERPEVPRKAPDEKPGWFDKPANVRRVIRGLFIVAGLVVLLDFFYEKHPHFAAEWLFGFYGFYGFVGCVTLVLLAKVLRRIVMRPEDYWDE